MNVFCRSAYNYDSDVVSLETGLCCEDVSLAKQSFAEEVDINTIVRRFNLTGKMPDDVRAPVYQDFQGIFDFHSAMNAVAGAGESFDQLPAEMRARFQNDPALFVDFCLNDKNRDELISMGLVVAPKPSEPPVAAGASALEPPPVGGNAEG